MPLSVADIDNHHSLQPKRERWIKCSMAMLALLCIGSVNASEAPPPTRVTTSTAAELFFNPTRSAPAVVEPLNQTRIASALAAQLIRIPVKVGDRLQAGDTFAWLDCRDFDHAVQAQQQQLAQQQQQSQYTYRQWQRSLSMKASSSVSEAELDAKQNAHQLAKIAVTAGEVSLSNAKNQQDRCQIKAPFNGVVSEKIAQTGQWLSPGMPVITLTQLEQQEVVANIAITDMQAFATADNFQLQAAGDLYPLQLRTLLPVINTTTRSQQARLVFSDKAAASGISGRLIWQAKQNHLPSDLLQMRDGRYGFFIAKAENGQVIAHFVSVEQPQEGRPFVSQLDPSTEVILAGRFGLIQNQPITINNK